MAITPPYFVDEEELMSIKASLEDDDGIDREIQEMVRGYLSLAAKMQDVEVLSCEALAWAAGVEGTAVEMAQTIGTFAEDVRRGAAVLALRSGEEAAVQALREQAALMDARRAEAEELAAATRLLQEKDLRRLAAAEHLVDPTCVVIVKCMPEVLDFDPDEVPTPEEMAAAAALENQVVRMHGRMVSLAERFRHGAAAFAARPGEEELVAALQRQAAKADELRAAAEVFIESVRHYQDAGSSPPAMAAGVENAKIII